MNKAEKPPRPWRMQDLQSLGRRGQKTYLKAIPVLILEKWVQGNRKEGVANYVEHWEINDRLVSSNLRPPYKPRGGGTALGSLIRVQSGQNLTNFPLIEAREAGVSWINLPYYEDLLQSYRKWYRQYYPADYKKLYPEKEPEWGQASLSKETAELEPRKALPSQVDEQDEISDLFAPLEKALRARKQAIERLTEEKQELHAQIEKLKSENQDLRSEKVRLNAEAVLAEVARSELDDLHRHKPFHSMILDDELRNDCAELLENEKYYIDAIRRASVVLEERLRGAVKGTGSKRPYYGASLVRYALSKESGKLVISEEPNEQDGIYQLFGGAFAFVRNPPAHKKVQYTELEAWQTISLIDYLLSLLKQAKPREQ